MKPFDSFAHAFRPRRGTLLFALAIAAALTIAPALAQYEAGVGDLSEDATFSSYPTLEGIRAARAAGHPTERILAWIRDQDAVFALDLEEVMQLGAEGVDRAIIVALTGLPGPEVGAILDTLETVYVARPGPREGLSKRRLMKMLELGVPEEEMLRAIAAEGSRAELSMTEAVDLTNRGVSPRLVVAIGRGIVPPEIAAQQAGAAVDPNAPLLDELVGEEGEEAGVLLDEVFEQEGVRATPEGPPKLVVLSDPVGARVSFAPGSIRPADMLVQSAQKVRAPAELDVDAGSWWILVEKIPDAYDAGIIPAFRTVHDGDGSTRTLIHSGLIFYDAERCCLPLGLAGPLKITRIGEGHPGFLLGDEFEGMPPYLWDGNRYLVLDVDEGRIRRVIKIYSIERAAGDERTLVSTFIPASADPLAYPPSFDAISTRARATWELPPEETLAAVTRMNGIPAEDLDRVRQRLLESGKVTWMASSADGVRIVILGLQTLGRLSLHEVRLDRSGPFGTLATPRPGGALPAAAGGAGGAKPPDPAAPAAAAVKLPGPLPPLRQIRTPGLHLPVLEVTNEGTHAALLRLEDGTILFVPAGGTAEAVVGPGTTALEARWDAEGQAPLSGRAIFSYQSRYRLTLR